MECSTNRRQRAATVIVPLSRASVQGAIDGVGIVGPTLIAVQHVAARKAGNRRHLVHSPSHPVARRNAVCRVDRRVEGPLRVARQGEAGREARLGVRRPGGVWGAARWMRRVVHVQLVRELAHCGRSDVCDERAKGEKVGQGGRKGVVEDEIRRERPTMGLVTDPRSGPASDQDESGKRARKARRTGLSEATGPSS